MSLGKLLMQIKAQGQTAFIPYITAGDPSLTATERFVTALVSAGADMVELGVPFSDPVADGPTNQKAAERALAQGTSLNSVLHFVEKLRLDGNGLPVVLFTYYNPVFKMGLKTFAQKAKAFDVNGVLTVDLPPEEAEGYSKILTEHGVETIFLASPTTSDQRLKLIDEASTGFVYYVSRTGVTGARKALSKTLAEELVRVRKIVRKPLVVGFGISTPRQAETVAEFADGVVVGSALVRLIEKHSVSDAVKKIRTLSSSIVDAIQPALR